MALYENERVSVIIPVFKVERFIEQTILSVVNQNYPDIEIVLVDDCSPDSSAAIIKNMQEKYTNIVYYKLDKNSGAAVARNKALDIATGRYVAFLDGDDMWAEGKLEKQMAYMKNIMLLSVVLLWILWMKKDRLLVRYVMYARR